MELDLLKGQKRLQDMDIEELKPLAIRYQELINKAEEAGLPMKQAEAAFWKEMGATGQEVQWWKRVLGGVSIWWNKGAK